MMFEKISSLETTVTELQGMLEIMKENMKKLETEKVSLEVKLVETEEQKESKFLYQIEFI